MEKLSSSKQSAQSALLTVKFFAARADLLSSGHKSFHLLFSPPCLRVSVVNLLRELRVGGGASRRTKVWLRPRRAAKSADKFSVKLCASMNSV
jgi:hypothetical protein